MTKEGYGVSKKDKPHYFDPQKWKQQKLEAMTDAAMRQKNAEFVTAHRDDTDGQLIVYVRQCAQELGHTPYPREIFGGAMIYERFGTWSKVLNAAGLPYPTHKVSDRGCRIYRQTMKEQVRVFDQLRAEKVEAIQAASAERNATAQAEKQARLERDVRWGESHGDMMSDDEILEYLRTCAGALGHSPYSYEVEGGRYIAGRFACWSIALTEAKLPLPKGCHKPRREQKLEFLARKNGCQPGRDPEAYTD